MEKPTRFEYNLLIINKLKELIIKYPDLRFGQLLINCDIIQYTNEPGFPVVEDPFNEESKVIWERMYNNKFAFNERFN